jgi:hypothetical protein
MFTRIIPLLLLVCVACAPNPFACPSPEKVRLKKRVGVNYKVLIARKRQQQPKITKAELRQLMSREYKTVTVEEWDCPRPGVKNVPKEVQDNIRKNKKRFNEYYKTRNSSDSLLFIAPNRK